MNFCAVLKKNKNKTESDRLIWPTLGEKGFTSGAGAYSKGDLEKMFKTTNTSPIEQVPLIGQQTSWRSSIKY